MNDKPEYKQVSEKYEQFLESCDNVGEIHDTENIKDDERFYGIAKILFNISSRSAWLYIDKNEKIVDVNAIRRSGDPFTGLPKQVINLVKDHFEFDEKFVRWLYKNAPYADEILGDMNKEVIINL